MIPQSVKSKKVKVAVLSFITASFVAVVGFFAYLSYGLSETIRLKYSAPSYSISRSNMYLAGGGDGFKLAYPSISGNHAFFSFYFVFAVALLISISLIILTFVYFYGLIQKGEASESALKSIEQNILEVPSAILHEIKGNINSIMLNSQILIKRTGSAFNEPGCACGAGDIARTGRLIESETSRLSQTMDNILRFTKENDILSLEYADMSELVEQAISDLSLRVSLQKIKFSTSVESGKKIMMDRELMFQALKNIMLNAAESYAGNAGDVLVYSSYKLNKFVLTVEDFGSGIDKDALQKIFQPFYTSGKKNGVGLGLALSKKIVDAHGFKIAMFSEKGKGTMVSIEMDDL